MKLKDQDSIPVINQQIIYDKVFQAFSPIHKYSSSTINEEHDYLIDCAKIVTLLMDKKACHAHLVKLNGLLLNAFEKQKRIIPSLDSPYKKGSLKILRSILEIELEKVGFKSKFLQVIGLLSRENFHSILKQGSMFKDSGFRLSSDDEHGELTHAIQWLFIVWHVEEKKIELKNSVIDIYKKFGSKKFVQEDVSLWEVMFDLQNTGNYEDNIVTYLKELRHIFVNAAPAFSCPELLIQYILKNQHKNEDNIDLLKYIISYRHGQEYKQINSYPVFFNSEHISKKSLEKESVNKNEQLSIKIRLIHDQKNDIKNYHLRYKKSEIGRNILEPIDQSIEQKNF